MHNKLQSSAIYRGDIKRKLSNINLLIVGSDGQVGSELKELMHNENVQDCDVKIHFSARDHLDITNKNTIKKIRIL